MPRVTVRLGALTRSDGRWAQKGVDAAMHTELTELARNRACSDIVLVTGDGDLLPGLMSAKEHGVAVHLWAVQAADGDYNQSEDLVAEADERRVLDRAWITRAVRAKDLTGICSPPPAPRPEIAAILSAPLPEAALAASAERAAEAAAAAGARGEGSDGHGTGGNGHVHHGNGHAGANGHLREDEHDRGHGSGVPAPASGKGVPTPKDLAGLRAPGATPPRAVPCPRAPARSAGPPTGAGSSAPPPPR